MKDSERSLPVRSTFERRQVVLGTAALLLLAIFVIREIDTSGGTSITFLYSLPVALCALELGIAGGLASAVAACALLAVWIATRHTGLTAGDFIVRASTLGLIGGIAGRFSDRMRSARARQQQLLEAGLTIARRPATETLPELVAKRATELVRARGARVTIEESGTAQIGRLDGATLTLELGTGPARAGILELAPPEGRPFTADERLALELLALQVTAAAETERIQALEREQAVLHSELSTAQGQLAEHGHRLALLLHEHENERSVLAHELHDQAAQALAAIQVGLGAVERDLGSEPTRAQVEMLRGYLGETLRTLRDLAVSLRPPALDQLGLEPALRTLAERAGVRAGHEVSLTIAGLEGRLDPEIETAAYRLVDDMLALAQGPVEVRVALDTTTDELCIGARQEPPPDVAPASEELLARIRARTELLGGTLAVNGDHVDELTAKIAAHAEPSARSAETLRRSR